MNDQMNTLSLRRTGITLKELVPHFEGNPVLKQLAHEVESLAAQYTWVTKGLASKAADIARAVEGDPYDQHFNIDAEFTRRFEIYNSADTLLQVLASAEKHGHL